MNWNSIGFGLVIFGLNLYNLIVNVRSARKHGRKLFDWIMFYVAIGFLGYGLYLLIWQS
jgi:hypothetical protein